MYITVVLVQQKRVNIGFVSYSNINICVSFLTNGTLDWLDVNV